MRIVVSMLLMVNSAGEEEQDIDSYADDFRRYVYEVVGF